MFIENNPEIVIIKGKYKYKNSKKNIPKYLENKIKKLGIPPAYNHLWVSKKSSSDIQAICLDSKGRKQYFYHTNWINKQTNKKYIRMYKFMKKMNIFWKTINVDSNIENNFTKKKVMAYMFKIMKITHIRIGNKKYLDSNNSIGLTTLKKKNISFKKDSILLIFKGKSGVLHKLEIKNKSIIMFIKELYKTPNEWLMQYKNNNKFYRINSIDMNKYLQSIIGKNFTCKDFRTHAANKLFIKNIQKLKIIKNTKSELKKNINMSLDKTALKMGHNKSTSKNSYINDKLIEEYTNFPLKIKKGNIEKILLKVYKM